jgi:cytochrome c oxidase cbb3-type subunit 3
VTVTTRDGRTIKGTLVHRDEFTVTIKDQDGWTRSWTLGGLDVTVDNPLQRHVEQLAKYSDRDMHNVLAYLQSLR